MNIDSCPCGSGFTFSNCCQPYLISESIPSTAEKLMRSRFVAFATKNFDYIINTTHPDSLKNFDQVANRNWMNSVEFSRLEVVEHHETLDKAQVEFKAWFKYSNQEHCHHEKSEFKKLNNKWYYCIK
jgi:SEC-C motif domain protein